MHCGLIKPTVGQLLPDCWLVDSFLGGAVLYFFQILFTWKDRTSTQDNSTVLIFMNFLIFNQCTQFNSSCWSFKQCAPVNLQTT